MATTRQSEGVDTMNRLELLGMLYFLDRLCEQKDLEGIHKVVTRMLEEAENEKKGEKKDVKKD